MSIAFVYFYNLLPFQLRQLRFHLCDQHLQLLLAFLARVRIHIPRVLFAVDPCRGVAAFKQVVVDLADAARAGLADFAHVRLKINDGRRIRLRRRLVRKFCLSDAAVDLPRGGVLHVRGRVRVNIQRRGRRHMPQHGGERFHVHPILQRQGRECVSEVMKTHLFAACVLQDHLQSVVDRTGVERQILQHRRREHPAGVDAFAVFPQHLHDGGRQHQLADGAFRLRHAHHDLAANQTDLFADREDARFKIEVVPLQRQQLAAPQTRRQNQQKQLIVTLGFRLNEKPLQFIPRQHLHLARLLGRQLAALGGIGADEPILYSPLKRRAAGRVTHPHHAVGQPLTIILRARLASALFEPRVKLLQVVLRQPVQRNLAQLRLDVQTNTVFIAGLRRGANVRLAVRFIPVIQPVGKAHLRPQLVRRNAAELRFERRQLFRAFALALAKNGLCFRVAVIIVLRSTTLVSTWSCLTP